MPLDVESLAALSELAGAVEPRHSPRSWPASMPPRRLGSLAAGSMVAGLLCGLVVPASAVAVSTTSASAAARNVAAARVLSVPATTTLLSQSALSPFGVSQSLSTSTTSATTTKKASSTHKAAVVKVPSIKATTKKAAGTKAATSLTATPTTAARTTARRTTTTSRVAIVPTVVAPAVVSPPVADPLPPRGQRQAALLAWVKAYHPTRPLPAHSGSGRRIVYAERAAHLWVVGVDGQVLRDYPVTGRVGRPSPAVYRVYSKSPTAYNPGEKLGFDFMVRFAYGITGARIGFHTIPRYRDGVPIQLESQLGQAIGMGGCVRQSRVNATWLFGWAHVGDTVVVLL